MKIIQVIGSLGDGGAERVVLNLDKLFRREGFLSKIVVLKEKTFYNIDNSLVINLNIHKSKAKEPLIKLLRDEKPNVILVHMQDMSRLIKDLDWDNIYNFIHTDIYERLNHINFFRRYKKRKDFKRVYTNKNIITVSKNIALSFKKMGIEYKRLNSIYNPFNIEEIYKLADEFIPKEQDYIVHVASLRFIKQQDILLKAFAKLSSTQKLLILGDGEDRVKLQKLIKELNIKKRVKLLGWQKNPYPYIKNAKLLVLSSQAEGLSNVLIESLILHTPVVSTDCNSGPREILVDDLSPFLAKVNDIDSLTKTMQKALDSYPLIEPKYYNKFSDNSILELYNEIIL